MGILDRVLSRIGYFKATDAQMPAWVLAQAAASRYNIAELAGTAAQQAQLYTQLDWISTAIDHVSNHAAGVVYNVKQRKDEALVDIPNHPFELLLHNPNPLNSRYELMRDLYSWYKLSGNGLLYLNRGSEQEPPAELWVMPSNLVQPVPDGKSYLKGYIFDAGQGVKVALETWEVCHVKTFNPLNPFWGLSAVQQLAVVSRGDLAQQQYNTNLFDKENAKIPGALAFKSMVQNSDWERLKAETKENWGGTSRKGPLMLRGVGTGGVEWLKMAMTQVEMEFLKSRQFTKEEIYGQLAPGLASVLAVNATEANAIAGKSILLEFGIYPMLSAIGAKFSKMILPAYGDGLVGEFDDVRESNRLIDIKEEQQYAETHTIDEIRDEYYGDDAMGDERGNLIPIELKNKGLAAVIQQAGETAMPGGQPVPEDTSGMQAMGMEQELGAWERFALARLGKKNAREFEPHMTPLLVATRIQAGLKSARTVEQVKAVFAHPAEPDLAEVGQRIADAIERVEALLK